MKLQRIPLGGKFSRWAFGYIDILNYIITILVSKRDIGKRHEVSKKGVLY